MADTDCCNMDSSNEDITKIINPMSIGGWHRLCNHCEQGIIPKESHTPTIMSETANEENNGDTNNAIPLPDVDEVSEEIQDITPTETQETEPVETGRPPVNANQGNQKNIICKFYRKGSCRHGKLGTDCKFKHPELCKRFIEHGSRQPRGCNKGRECKYLHPQMCINSLRSGKCLSQHCRFRHIKGTTRHNVRERSTHDTNQQNRGAIRENQRDQHANDGPHQSEPNNEGSFLEALRLLKAELIQVMDTKLKEIPQQPLYHPQVQHQYVAAQGRQRDAASNQYLMGLPSTAAPPGYPPGIQPRIQMIAQAHQGLQQQQMTATPVNHTAQTVAHQPQTTQLNLLQNQTQQAVNAQ